MKRFIIAAVVAASLVGGAVVAHAGGYRTCNTTCFGNSCTTSCY
jgi:hypothetical protein